MIKRSTRKVAAYVGKAYAAQYTDSRRVILVADDGSFEDARKALDELRDEVS